MNFSNRVLGAKSLKEAAVLSLLSFVSMGARSDFQRSCLPSSDPKQMTDTVFNLDVRGLLISDLRRCTQELQTAYEGPRLTVGRRRVTRKRIVTALWGKCRQASRAYLR